MSQKKEGYVVIPSRKPASVHPDLPGALDRVSKDLGGLSNGSKDQGRKALEGGGLKERTTFSGNNGTADVLPAELP